MMQIDTNSYLIDFDKKEEYKIGSIIFGKTIVSMELYYLESKSNNSVDPDIKKYIKLTTAPINFQI